MFSAMALRLFAILMLVLQPVAGLGGVSLVEMACGPAAGVQAAPASCCCMAMGMAAMPDDCPCAVSEPAETPEPTPAPAPVRSGAEIVVVLLAPAAPVVTTPEADRSWTVRPAREAFGASRDRAAARASTGVWRT